MWQHKITLCPCLLWRCPLLKLLKSTHLHSPTFKPLCVTTVISSLGVVENALVYIAGFVVRQILRKLSCDVCRASLVRDARPASFDKSFHLLALKNNGGLVIPSQGTVKVLRAAERVIRQASAIQAPKVSTVTHIVWEEIGTEDVFLLGEHIEETKFGIDNNQSDLLSLVVSVFLKIRLHHVAKLASLELQKGSTRKNLCKTVLFQGF